VDENVRVFRLEERGLPQTVDIVMWAKDGAAFLPFTLKRISEVLPEKVVHEKIFVDDHSVDESASIADSFGWSVYDNPSGGIGGGFKEALKHVDCPFFASFEQDLLLSRKWWPTVPLLMRKKRVVVAQGWRLPSHPVLNAIEKVTVDFKPVIGAPLYSIDNNVYETEVIRKLAGGLEKFHYAVDSVLLARILDAGFTWVTEQSVLSIHLKPVGFAEYIRGRYGAARMAEYFTLASRKQLPPSEVEKFTFKHVATRLAISPLVGLALSYVKRQPWLSIYYPMLRIQLFKSFKEWIKIEGNKKTVKHVTRNGSQT